jgi:hypothetical protein
VLCRELVGEDMVLMEMGIDLEGDEPGEVSKCMLWFFGVQASRVEMVAVISFWAWGKPAEKMTTGTRSGFRVEERC